MLDRREFLKAGVGLGVGFVAYQGLRSLRVQAAPPYVPPVSPILTKYVDQLPIPPTIPASQLSTLTMASSTHSFHSQLGAGPTFGYQGASYLGPTIEAVRGQPISFTAQNNLGAHPLSGSIDTTLHGALTTDAASPRVALHLHGGNVEPASDGFPEDIFTPGNRRTFNYNNNQEAATLWYHDHALGITRLNVVAGLAGFYLLRDADDTGAVGNPLGLPAGEFEIPLVLQDRSFNANGSLFYTPKPWAPEFFGDVATVNGKAWPNLNVRQCLYRFRLLNGSNARFYNLSFSDKSLSFIQIGAEGGLFNAPAILKELLIAPGERADVLVDFSRLAPGSKIILQNSAVAPFPSGKPRARAGGSPLPQIMQFTVVSGAGCNGTVPTTLRKSKPLITPINAFPAPVQQRYLTLAEIMGAAGPLVVLLNYMYWDEAMMNSGFMEQPQVNTLEQWNIINLTADTHPIHLHLVQFRVLNRQKLNVNQYLKAYTAPGPRTVMQMNPPAPGGPTVPAGYPPIDPTPYLSGAPTPPRANEVGWKDTVQANPGEVTRLLVPFGANIPNVNIPFGNSFTGLYVWHCHLLDHEDNEMMLPYTVV
ncbi:MAG TPA: multicopper oxidase [Stenomitos sp.]